MINDHSLTPALCSDPPRIITAPKDQLIVTGRVATFVCAAIGNPKPQIEWRRNGKRLVTQRYTVLEIPNGSVLRIESVRPVCNTILLHHNNIAPQLQHRPTQIRRKYLMS